MVYKEDTVYKSTLEYFQDDVLATSVWMGKYALKNKEGEFVEKNPEDTHRRLAKEFARIEKKFGGKEALSYNTILKALKGFKGIVPQGSPMYGIGNDYNLSSLSNCTVIASPEDNISSIFDRAKDLANLSKRRAGVGLDISLLRPEHTKVNNAAGTTTGAWSFADLYSFAGRMIGQNGRRAAIMITMDIRHPDIFQFSTMKNDKTKVTGANVSVKLNDDFMNAVKNDDDFELYWPVASENPTITRTIKARDLWQTIIDSATHHAEPGLLMWNSITSNLPADFYDEFKTVSCNPCSEISLSEHDACRLISINLKHLVKNPFTSKAEFDHAALANLACKAMRLSDDLVELEVEKIKQIIDVCDTDDEKVLWGHLLTAAEKGRRTGLGTHGLADVFARLGLRYDSEEATVIADGIYYTLKVNAYAESVRLAKQRGSFPVFDWETEKDCAFIQRLPEELKEGIKKYGRRNISILTNAPTGSVSCVSQTSSGIEPVFRNELIRRKKLSHNENKIKPDFVDDSGDRWLEYEVFHHNVYDWMRATNKKIKDLAPYFVTSEEIDWRNRVKLQAAIQCHLDHSISSTINLPKGTTSDTVSQIYFESWKAGLKGVTVYVDGSRNNVLREKKDLLRQSVSPKRPKELPCDIHQTVVRGTPWMVFVGMMENDSGEEVPYEVFAGEASKLKIPKRYTRGLIIKHARKTTRSVYDLATGEGDDELYVSDVVDTFDAPTNATFTRTISLALRHGTPVTYLVEQLRKDEESNMFTFSKAVARVLKKYIKNGEKPGSDKVCTECGSESLTYNDGCVMCTACGWSKCM